MQKNTHTQLETVGWLLIGIFLGRTVDTIIPNRGFDILLGIGVLLVLSKFIIKKG